jgi:hypothetical protein
MRDKSLSRPRPNAPEQENVPKLNAEGLDEADRLRKKSLLRSKTSDYAKQRPKNASKTLACV